VRALLDALAAFELLDSDQASAGRWAHGVRIRFEFEGGDDGMFEIAALTEVPMTVLHSQRSPDGGGGGGNAHDEL
jgi:hypothetical protein